MQKMGFHEALNHNVGSSHKMAGEPAEHERTELIHHMSHGEPEVHTFMPHEMSKMAEHMEDCPHCSGGLPAGDKESSAGAAE